MTENNKYVEKLLLKAAAKGHAGAKRMLDSAREAGILRPNIPKTEPLNAPKRDGAMNPVSYSAGYDPADACSEAVDKAECLRLKQKGLGL